MRKIEAFEIIDEPGDATHYEFIIALAKDRHFIFISRGENGAKFESYTYRIDSIENFVKDYPILIEALDESEYQKKVASSMDDPFIGYIASHSNCNPWTAIAAVRAMMKFIIEEVI